MQFPPNINLCGIFKTHIIFLTFCDIVKLYEWQKGNWKNVKLENCEIGKFSLPQFPHFTISRSYRFRVSKFPIFKFLNFQIPKFPRIYNFPHFPSFQNFLTNELTSAPNVASVKTSLTIRQSKYLPGVPLNK